MPRSIWLCPLVLATAASAGCFFGPEIPSDDTIGDDCIVGSAGEALIRGDAIEGGELVGEAGHDDLGREDGAQLSLSADISTSTGPGCFSGGVSYSFPIVRFVIPADYLELGEHQVVMGEERGDAISVEFSNESGGRVKGDGLISFDGWNGDTGALCGRYQVDFEDGTSAAGTFKARAVNYGSGSTALCGPEQDEHLYCSLGATPTEGGAATLLVIAGMLLGLRRRRRPLLAASSGR